MTVRDLIKQLLDMPMQSQVVDTNGDPIIYAVMKWDQNRNVFLEPKSQIDVYEYLDTWYSETENSSENDIDLISDLLDQGITLDDIKDYNEGVYRWAMFTLYPNMKELYDRNIIKFPDSWDDKKEAEAEKIIGESIR